MNLRGKITALLMLAVVVLFAYLLFQDKKSVSYIYPDFGVSLPQNFQALGIDVSHHQGEINWADVRQMRIGFDSVQFAYIKATEGISHVDKQYETNAEEAAKNEIPFGFYHFYNPAAPVIAQADHFIRKTNTHQASLRPVLDVENEGKLKSTALVDSVKKFLVYYEETAGIRPMIYTGESFYRTHFAESVLKQERYWIANYNGSCDLIDLPNVYLWQFSESGTVNGIGEAVDLNVAKPGFWNEIKLDIK
jgi:lysozyme